MKQPPKYIIIFFSIIISGFLFQCGIYTFSGSTLPSHLKTINVPLFSNLSLQPGIAEFITEQLNRSILDNKLLKPVARNADAQLSGKVLSYSNQPYTYDHTNSQNTVSVSSYVVTISVEVEFYDVVKNKQLYTGTITQEGIYDYSKQQEIQGREIAVKKIIDLILQNSVQQW